MINDIDWFIHAKQNELARRFNFHSAKISVERMSKFFKSWRLIRNSLTFRKYNLILSNFGNWRMNSQRRIAHRRTIKRFVTDVMSKRALNKVWMLWYKKLNQTHIARSYLLRSMLSYSWKKWTKKRIAVSDARNIMDKKRMVHLFITSGIYEVEILGSKLK